MRLDDTLIGMNGQDLTNVDRGAMLVGMKQKNLTSLIRYISVNGESAWVVNRQCFEGTTSRVVEFQPNKGVG